MNWRLSVSHVSVRGCLTIVIKDGKAVQWITFDTFDAYPGFGVFVNFVSVNDPLYGSSVHSPKRPVEKCKHAHTASHNMATAHNKGSLQKMSYV